MKRSRIYHPEFRKAIGLAVLGGIDPFQAAQAIGVHYTTVNAWKNQVSGDSVTRPRLRANGQEILLRGEAFRLVKVNS